MAVEADLALRQRQLFARSDAELPLDEIEPGDRLGHRMLDLKPRVHLDEPEPSARSPPVPSATNSTVPAPL